MVTTLTGQISGSANAWRLMARLGPLSRVGVSREPSPRLTRIRHLSTFGCPRRGSDMSQRADDAGGRVTSVSQKSSMELTTFTNWSRSSGFVM